MKHKPRHHLNFVRRPLCGGKNRYPKRFEAGTVKLEQEVINQELELKIYHCISCGDWHLARSTKTDT